jgi:5-methylcytosine-specific restriction protein A
MAILTRRKLSKPTGRTLTKSTSWAADDEKAAIKFYKGKYWRGIRAEQLRAQRFCEKHLLKGEHIFANVVDHVRERNEGGTDEPENLQSLCHRCHNRKSARYSNK